MIKAVYADTGHWLARCDHDTGVIELNRREYPRLSPLMRDYVWCHEWVHLIYNIKDEAQCNAVVNQIFVNRGKTEKERFERLEFVEHSQDAGNVSGMAGIDDAIFFAVAKVIDMAEDFVTDRRINKATFAANENSGFNALSDEDKRYAVDTFLDYAFKKAKRSSERTAQDFFMAKMEPFLTPLSISSYAALVARYGWIGDEVAVYEKKYGFGFMEVKPADYKDVYVATAVVLALLALSIYLIYRYKTKK